MSYTRKKINKTNNTTFFQTDGVMQTIPNSNSSYITAWGDSLTAQGGWTTTLSTLSGLPIFNGATGGENARTIVSRQGADVMIINNITIPATPTPVLIADRDVDTGINTQFGYKSLPLLQGGTNHVNPCNIGGINGTLSWTGSDFSDMTGDWVFTRLEPGTALAINRPTAIKTNYDINKNNPYLQVIFIGQNGGYTDDTDLIRQHRLMIEHARANHTIVLGLSSGTSTTRANYESVMLNEFGRYFISLRQYLVTYGLSDSLLTPTTSDTNAQAIGQVPPQLLSDAVHYTTTTRTVIGNMIYKKCQDLNIF
mgnify:CR=1 FL=1